MTEVHVVDADGTNGRRVSPDGLPADWPSWAPGGDRVAFLAGHDGLMQVHVADRDGKGARKLSDGPHGAALPRFGPDGRLAYLLLGRREFKRQPADLVVADDRKGTAATLVKDALITDWAWSPDGSVIAYGKPAALVFLEVGSGREQGVAFTDIDRGLANHAAVEIGWSPDGRAVACRMVFWGGRPAHGPKMLGDEEVFVIPRSGKPAWFPAGGAVQHVEWLKDK